MAPQHSKEVEPNSDEKYRFGDATNYLTKNEGVTKKCASENNHDGRAGVREVARCSSPTLERGKGSSSRKRQNRKTTPQKRRQRKQLLSRECFFVDQHQELRFRFGSSYREFVIPSPPPAPAPSPAPGGAVEAEPSSNRAAPRSFHTRKLPTRRRIRE